MWIALWLCSALLATVGVAPRRDFAGLEQRRKQAGKLFGKGKSQADVARELGVSRQSVSRWYADWQTNGAKGLATAGRAGRLPRLDDRQLAHVAAELEKGARAHGYPTDLWTLARVAEVIEATTGVSYHPGQVWRVLHQMGWSRQRPARRAVERDDEAIARWASEDRPRIKKRPQTQNLDLLPRRERLQPPPLGEVDLGAQGQDAGAAAPFQLEAAVDVGRRRLRAGRRRRPARLRDHPGRLQRRAAGRVPRRAAPSPRWRYERPVAFVFAGLGLGHDRFLVRRWSLAEARRTNAGR